MQARWLLLGVAACGATADRPTPTDGESDVVLTDTGAVDAAPAGALPPLPVGLDAIRRWDLWPLIRRGMRTYLRSTYDRAGGNESADAAHHLHQRADGVVVPLALEGPGLLSFVRTNHWHGSPWHYVVDGADHVVQETTTKDPTKPVEGSVFEPTAAFPSPLTYTWSVTRGADLSWVPIGFTQGFTLGYGRMFYSTGYYVFSRFDPDAALSRPLVAWDPGQRPDPDVLALLSRSGEDLAPKDTPALERTVDLPASGGIVVAELVGQGSVRALRITAPAPRAVELGRARLRITWDGRKDASVDAPIALFFGAGTLYRRTAEEWLVRAFPVSVRFPKDRDVVELSTYFPMPFFERAKIELVSDGVAIEGLTVHVRTAPLPAEPVDLAYFHATFRDHGVGKPGHDHVLLDTTTVEGGGDFCGSFVGTTYQFSDRAELRTLEGDPRFLFDDAESPQAQGTGSEEWGGGGDYWGGRTMTLPFAGHPVGAPMHAAKDAEDGIESAYRFLLSDLFPFGKNARIQLEHGGANDSAERYKTVTYWYGAPRACLVRSDRVKVGDVADEAAHAFQWAGDPKVEALTSRFELGVDHLGAEEIYPATTDTGRHGLGTSVMTLRLPADNVGALLRRKLDYGFADQRARVFVADDRDGAPFVLAGVWHLAGSNRCLYTPVGGELATMTPLVQESNRRFREDEFVLPRHLVAGRSRVRVRLEPFGAATPLLPGTAAPPNDWSAFRYDLYAWVR
ncbi:MAG: DUF2961 domain-containing protein [Myxococcales bacterium]|nr:DUF2961 domain-containing protein [Myxococcales bacterium]